MHDLDNVWISACKTKTHRDVDMGRCAKERQDVVGDASENARQGNERGGHGSPV